MNLIMGGRHTGKTAKCIEMLKNNPDMIYICGLALMRDYLYTQYPQLKQRIFTVDDFIFNKRHLIKQQKKQIMLDDANDLIQKLLNDFFETDINTVCIYDDKEDKKWGGVWKNPYLTKK